MQHGTKKEIAQIGLSTARGRGLLSDSWPSATAVSKTFFRQSQMTLAPPKGRDFIKESTVHEMDKLRNLADDFGLNS